MRDGILLPLMDHRCPQMHLFPGCSVLTLTSAPLLFVQSGNSNEPEPRKKISWILKFVHIQQECGTEPYWNRRQEEDSVILFMTLSKILRFCPLWIFCINFKF